MGIMFFEKNKIDLSLLSLVDITVTDAVASNTGQDFVDAMRNRRNDSGWATTDSSDAANTQIDVDMGESHDCDTIILLGINWKAYTIKYWNGSAYVDFSTPIAVTGNADAEKKHSFTDIEFRLIRIIITQAFVVDDDKFCTQMIVTQLIGEFQSLKPMIDNPTIGKNRRTLRALSGKGKVLRTTGAFQFTMKQNGVVNEDDMDLVEALHDFYDGFLVWLCGNDVSQFRFERQGYRKRDIYYMNITSEYRPEWDRGMYKYGINLNVDLIEVI